MTGINRCNVVAGIAFALTWTGAALAQHEHGDHEKEHAARPAEQKGAKLPLCPVMGDPVDFGVSTMTDDGPVYFCCKSCIKKFEKDPDKYAEKTAAQRQALSKMERVQVSCPVSGNPVSDKGNPVEGRTFAMIGGRGVHFCCERCISKYQQDPDKYRAKLEASYTYQTRCPVSGDKIDPTAYVDLPSGERIYLCCPGCGEKLLKEPAKYAPKLSEQGVNIDLKKLEGKTKEDGEHGGHGGHEHP